MSVRISVAGANDLLDGLKAQLDLGFINIYSGTSQPTLPSDAANGTLLATFSIENGGTGLTWDTPANGEMGKPSAIWRALGVADNTAGWCRIYSAGDTSPGVKDETGLLPRVDMICTRTGSTECILSTLTIAVDDVITIDSATIVMPRS